LRPPALPETAFSSCISMVFSPGLLRVRLFTNAAALSLYGAGHFAKPVPPRSLSGQLVRSGRPFIGDRPDRVNTLRLMKVL
jgi:hypothetical protein